MIPLFLFMLMNLLLITVPAVVALVMRRIWTAGLLTLGGLIGILGGFATVWILMAIEEARSGFDAGNGGVLFVCSIPTGCILGVVLGGLWGFSIEERKNPRKRESVRHCPQCGYSMRGLNRAGCPECGWKRSD